MKQTFIKSAMNYQGGKFKYLDQLLPLFPEHINTLIEPFCGGLNVALNVQANRYICNDINNYVINLYKYFQSTPEDEVFSEIRKVIEQYELNDQNKSGYMALREEYNRTHKPLLLYLLICHGYNHQIRFNQKGGFNNPFGKNRSWFNEDMEHNLHTMLPRLKGMEFSSKDFKDLNYSLLKPGDFLFADPPYTLSCASYNDGKRCFDGWTPDEDKALFGILDGLTVRGIKWMLTDFTHKGNKVNQPLIDWASRYVVTELNSNYKNSSYNSKEEFTREVIVKNY